MTALERVLAAGDEVSRVLGIITASARDATTKSALAEWAAAVAAIDLHPPATVDPVTVMARQPDGTVLAATGDTIERHAGSCPPESILSRTCTGGCLTEGTT